MEIKKLAIKNFRSYKGLTEFDFSIKDDKNIILIGGENGAGKTSIFEAIKLCIYGPLNYGYQGMVTNYISNIKSLINEDSYSDRDMESYISMDIKLTVDGEENIYRIKRRWTFDQQRLVEDFTVSRDGNLLDDEDKSNFNNYFKTIIPPNIFDLFFFDGEKLIDFFETSNASRILKESILELNNLDIFTILAREVKLNSRKRDREKKELEKEIKVLEKLEDNFRNKEEEYKDKKKELEGLGEEIDRLKIDIENENKNFIKAGGLNKEERDNILRNITLLEEERKRINQDIKDYANDYLPFNILERQLERLKVQIAKEEDHNRYKIIEEEFSNSELESLVRENIKDEENVASFIEKIKATIVGEKYSQEFLPIHNLSLEEKNNILRKIGDVEAKKEEDIRFFDRLDEIKREIALYRDKLRESLSENEEKIFVENINKMNEDFNSKIREKENLSVDVEKVKIEIEKIARDIEKIEEKIDIVRRAENVRDINKNINDMTEYLLRKVTDKKKREIEEDFIYMFSRIIRKDKYIDYIYIDDDFDITLYQKKSYSKKELLSLVENIGKEEMEKKMGTIFVAELENLDEDISESQELELSTKIDVMKLSSGEKQIYILCLYWAIIKSADLRIPFIIDTPYGRIDRKHRYRITKDFFPNISHQVIIFSTNTEVEGDLYREIRTNVSNEYTLDYIMETRSTKVSDGYFEEVM